jgi:hypothetical protein
MCATSHRVGTVQDSSVSTVIGNIGPGSWSGYVDGKFLPRDVNQVDEPRQLVLLVDALRAPWLERPLSHPMWHAMYGHEWQAAS